MKTYLKKIIDIPIFHVLCIVYCFTLPFYAFRIPMFFTSFSIVSACSILLLCTFFLKYYDYQQKAKDKILWILASMFILSFLPTLIMHPSSHAIGVFVEWLLLPIAVSYALYLRSFNDDKICQLICTSLFFSFLSVLIISLFYAFFGYLSYDGRLSGMFSSPNHLAMYITPLLALYLTILRKKNPYYINIIISSSLGLLILLLTQSFTSIAALVVASFIYVSYIHRKKVQIIALFIFFGLMILTVGASIKILHSSILQDHNSLTSRFAIWDCTIFLVQQSPIFGYAIDSFQDHYLVSQKYFTPYPEWAVPTPHNLFLILLFSGGIFSLLFFLLLCGRVLYLFTSMPSGDVKDSSFIYPVIIFLILFTGINDASFWKIDLSHIFWISICLFAISHHKLLSQ